MLLPQQDEADGQSPTRRWDDRTVDELDEVLQALKEDRWIIVNRSWFRGGDRSLDATLIEHGYRRIGSAHWERTPQDNYSLVRVAVEDSRDDSPEKTLYVIAQAAFLEFTDLLARQSEQEG